ncbi:serine hydrolase [Aerococcus urinaeequi]|uniref:serine hydrolase n=1 Tax=Aerococcus urinaeequi TaxID=51665 RepID=UPI003D6A4C0D
MSKRRKKSSIKPLVPFFVLGVALIAVLIAIFKYNDEDKGDASSDSLTATVDESTASDSLGNTPLTLSDEEVYNIDLMQASGIELIDTSQYASIDELIEATMAEFGVDESQVSLQYTNFKTDESYTINESTFQTAASTIKLPLAVMYVDAIEEGYVDWDTEVTYTYADYEEGDGTITAAVGSGTGQAAYTIEDLIANALMYSDNTATNMLIRYYNELYGSETYKTSIASSVDVAIDEAFYSDNVASAELLSAYYDLLATDGAYQPLVDYLLDASPDRLFTTYVNSSLMANKYGNYGTALNDGGIYYENDEAQYSLVALTDGLTDGTGFLENLNLRVNQYYRANYA